MYNSGKASSAFALSGGTERGLEGARVAFGLQISRRNAEFNTIQPEISVAIIGLECADLRAQGDILIKFDEKL